MGIPLNSILNLTEEQIDNSKIELNMKDGRTREPFIDRWLDRPESERAAGLAKRCSYWTWYRADRRNFKEGNWVFSFMRLYRSDEWLFVSAAEILETPEYGAENGYATVRILEDYAPLFGRLVINLHKGNKFSLYVFSGSTSSSARRRSRRSCRRCTAVRRSRGTTGCACRSAS